MVDTVSVFGAGFFFLHHLDGFEHYHRQDLVQRVHTAALQPLGDRRPRVVEPEPLEDVVDSVGLDLASGPADQPDGGLEVPGVTLELAPVVLQRVDLLLVVLAVSFLVGQSHQRRRRRQRRFR